ncbi:MAG: nucleotide exchange factor GrpE [Anaerolineae bacterium]|jgi:molecular chaperone GrpE|nr:nucleotide exchange factor GrpE [Anaerolineae bacterium]
MLNQQTRIMTNTNNDQTQVDQETSETVDTTPETTPPPSTEDGGPFKAQAEEYLAGWQRTRAEFANYKKRVDREMSESRQKGAHEALTKILPLIDDFERAMENVPTELSGNPWINGVGLFIKKFEKLLHEFEIQTLDPVGQPFDPSKHEAIGMEDSDTIESGHVTITLQKGYVSGDKVLRPALVKVAN